MLISTVLRRVIKFLAVVAFAVMTVFPSVSFADGGIYVSSAKIDQSGNYYRLTTTQSISLGSDLTDTLHRGVPLYFKTELEISTRQLMFFDMTALSKTRTARLSYNVLTRQYTVYIPGSLQRSYRTLDNALSAVRYQPSWSFANVSELSDEDSYDVAVRIGLDVSQLPKPFQMNALNSRDWGMTSEWRHFSYTP